MDDFRLPVERILRQMQYMFAANAIHNLNNRMVVEWRNPMVHYDNDIACVGVLCLVMSVRYSKQEYLLLAAKIGLVYGARFSDKERCEYIARGRGAHLQQEPVGSSALLGCRLRRYRHVSLLCSGYPVWYCGEPGRVFCVSDHVGLCPVDPEICRGDSTLSTGRRCRDRCCPGD